MCCSPRAGSGIEASAGVLGPRRARGAWEHHGCSRVDAYGERGGTSPFPAARAWVTLASVLPEALPPPKAARQGRGPPPGPGSAPEGRRAAGLAAQRRWALSPPPHPPFPRAGPPGRRREGSAAGRYSNGRAGPGRGVRSAAPALSAAARRGGRSRRRGQRLGGGQVGPRRGSAPGHSPPHTPHTPGRDRS